MVGYDKNEAMKLISYLLLCNDNANIVTHVNDPPKAPSDMLS